MNEIWRTCPDQPDYEISSSGRIRRSKPNAQGRGKGCIIKPKVGSSKYLFTCLGATGNRKNYLIHRLVLRAFKGEPPTPKHWVAHNDGRLLNNDISNLRWTTPAENQADKKTHGTHLSGELIGNSKLTYLAVMAIRTKWAASPKHQIALAAEYGISQGQISRIVQGQHWAGIEVQ